MRLPGRNLSAVIDVVIRNLTLCRRGKGELTDLLRDDGEAVQKESKNSIVLRLRCGSKAIPSKGLYSV